MKKVIEILKGGFVWHIDLEYVADNRAKYYAEKDKETTYQDEYDFVMEDDYQGIDWYQNNMDFEDVPFDRRRLVSSPKTPDSPNDIHWADDEELDIKEVTK